MTAITDRFWDKVDIRPFGQCWEWRAGRTPGGYGRVKFQGRYRSTHCVAYELLIGEIPEGLEIDHLCRNRGCVNVAHLEAVPHRVNCQRGAKGAVTECRRGHSFTAANTYWRTDGRRRCRACARLLDKTRRRSR